VQILGEDLFGAPVSAACVVERLHDLGNVVLANLGRHVLQENVQVLKHRVLDVRVVVSQEAIYNLNQVCFSNLLA